MKLLAPLAFALFASAPGLAAEVGSIYYDVRYAGIHIATSKISGSVENNAYNLSIDSDYSVVFYSGTVSGRVNGKRQGDKIFPQTYLMASGGEPEYRTGIEFEANAARKITIEPPLEPNWNEGRVPLKPENSQNVLDPMSALVFASLHAGLDAKNACNTTLPVFTGLSRFDLIFSPQETKPTAARAVPKKEDGPPIIRCKVRFVPVAGHRPSNLTIKVLTETTSISIDFDAEPVGPVRLPRRIEIPTRFGTVVVARTAKEPS